MKFFTAVLGTCKSTKVFDELLTHSLAKTLLHLFILAFLCSSFILLFTYSDSTKRIDETFSKLETTFGDIQITKEGLKAEKVKENKSLLIADDLFQISYLPQADAASLKQLDAKGINNGLLWTPTLLAFWVRISPDKILLTPFAYYSNKILVMERVQTSLLAPYIKNNTSLKDEFICQVPELSWTALHSEHSHSEIHFSELLELFFFDLDLTVIVIESEAVSPSSSVTVAVAIKVPVLS